MDFKWDLIANKQADISLFEDTPGLSLYFVQYVEDICLITLLHISIPVYWIVSLLLSMCGPVVHKYTSWAFIFLSERVFADVLCIGYKIGLLHIMHSPSSYSPPISDVPQPTSRTLDANSVLSVRENENNIFRKNHASQNNSITNFKSLRIQTGNLDGLTIAPTGSISFPCRNTIRKDQCLPHSVCSSNCRTVCGINSSVFHFTRFSQP